jgi:cystathionine gamma-synthase
MLPDHLGLGTLSVWAGEEEYLMQHATQVPVVHSVSFGYRDVDEWLQVARGQKPGHIYGRNTNPTVQVFEEKVRVLEGAEAATSAATGMGIISSTLFALLSPVKILMGAPIKSSPSSCRASMWR